jgi:hypothetical protein
MFQTASTVFPHQRLEAYRVALQLAAAARRLGTAIPRGHRSVVDHLIRAAANRGGRSGAKSSEVDGGPARPAVNTVLLLAEGADRRSTGEKRQRFVESRVECGEVAAAAELALVLGHAPPAAAVEVQQLAAPAPPAPAPVAAMLTRLLQRLG